jgi:homogentisate 1,2-dioxygenase
MTQLYRNGDGDDMLFIHAGSGELFCDYGHLSYRDGDYILIPRSTSWRIEPAETTTMLLIEASNGAYQLPDKGIVGPHAIFDEAMLDVPAIDDAFRAQQTEDEWQVVIKRHNALSTVTYPFNPLDAIGWHGTVAVARINWRDIRP